MEEILYCEAKEFIREIKNEGLYLMLSKNKKEILFHSEDSPREELMERIRDNSDVVVSFLNEYGYFDA